MEWARRAESLYVKHRTLEPNSASEAAPEAPAKPVPTNRTVYLRRLAGFTSFKSIRCRLHFCSIGPGGILAFNRDAVAASVVICALIADTPPYLTRPVRTAIGTAIFPRVTPSA